VIGAEHRLDRELVHRIDFALFGCHVLMFPAMRDSAPLCLPPFGKVNQGAGSKSG
jgi:hypothetical protein